MIKLPQRGERRASSSGLSVALYVEILEKCFNGKAILKDIEFSLKAGETLAITGPSGSGKSTVLRLVAGLDGDFKGHIQKQGRLGYVFQEPVLLPWLNAEKNLTQVCKITPDAALAALSSVGLEHVADHYPDQLSLGQTRRLALARALSVQPEILLLDEAFVSLDNALANEMMTLFENLRGSTGVSTLMVTHDHAEASRLADRILNLSGRPAKLSA